MASPSDRRSLDESESVGKIAEDNKIVNHEGHEGTRRKTTPDGL